MIASSSETTQDEDEETSAWYVGKIFEPLLPTEGHYSTRSSSANALAEEIHTLAEGESTFGSEMEWAGKYILNKQTEERIAGRDYGARTIASRYDLKSLTVQSWIRKVKCGSTFYDTRERPECQ